MWGHFQISLSYFVGGFFLLDSVQKGPKPDLKKSDLKLQLFPIFSLKSDETVEIRWNPLESVGKRRSALEFVGI